VLYLIVKLVGEDLQHSPNSTGPLILSNLIQLIEITVGGALPRLPYTKTHIQKIIVTTEWVWRLYFRPNYIDVTSISNTRGHVGTSLDPSPRNPSSS
jgi:hypothetical protein